MVDEPVQRVANDWRRRSDGDRNAAQISKLKNGGKSQSKIA